MTEDEFALRLRQIGETAKKQREGPYDARSDAVQALFLIETVALLLIDMWNAREDKQEETRT